MPASTSFDLSSLRINPSDLHLKDCWLYATYDSSLLVDIRTLPYGDDPAVAKRPVISRSPVKVIL